MHIRVSAHRLRSLFVLVCLVSAATATAQEIAGRTWPPNGFRRHTALRAADGTALYLITDIIRPEAEVSEHTILIEDQTLHERFIYRSRTDLPKHLAMCEISDVAGKKFVRRSYPFVVPSAATTLPGVIADLHANPKLYETVEAVLTFETPSFSEKVTDRALKDAKTRQTLISNIRESLDPHFLESLELMRYRGFGASHAAWAIKATVDEFLFHGEYVGAEKAHETEEAPDCGFDKAFGFACSEAQLEKIEKARSEGRRLGAY
jgi:hypothetical protein